jgi:predicted ATP-binding protein involved in virulence
MKIRKLQLKNIGVFDDETIEFQPCPAKDKAEIHILTGQNGSGKTTILMALASLFSLGSNEDDDSLRFNLDKNNFEKRLRNNSSTVIGFRVEDGNEISRFTFHIGKIIQPKMKFGEDKVAKQLRSYLNRQLPERKIRYLGFSFAAFAYSGYREIKNENIELNKKNFRNYLYQALDFVKEENPRFTINQWLADNLSKRALAKEENSKEFNKFDENIKNLEKAIADIIGYKISFKLKTNLNLVLIENDKELDFDVLPDGLKSLISWIGDLLMRLDSLEWGNNEPIFDRPIILFLDEIEIHLHPAWQRKVLPVVQKLFKNSQIFVSTHSPFVVNSVDDAWVYKLELENGKAKVAEIVRSEDGISYQTVLSEIFGINEEFGGKTQEDLDRFYKIVRNGKKVNEMELKKLAKSLAEQSEELNAIVQIELRQLSRRRGKEISI